MQTPSVDQTLTYNPVEAAVLRWLELFEEGSPIDLGALTAGLDESQRADFETRRARIESVRARLKGVIGHAPTEPGLEPTGAPGRYVDLTWRAAGGMGDVYLARDVELGRDVAYKVMKPSHGDPDRVRRRFAREAEVTAKLQSPGIVPVFGLVEDGSGRPAYAMEFVEGPTLRDLIRKFHDDFPAPAAGRRESAARAEARVGLLRQMMAACRIVAYAHAHRPAYVHCDLKPGNIMIDAQGATRVLDWGLARPVADPARDDNASGSSTEPEGWSGTPGYVAPSLKTGGPMTRNCDVYGLGATLATILYGLTPSGVPALDRAGAPDVPRPLRSIVTAAMADRPDSLYPTAAEMAADLQRYLEGEPVAADREPPTERAWRWVSRHKTATSVGLLSILLVVVGVAAVALVKVRLERQYREDALRNLALAHLNSSEGLYAQSKTPGLWHSTELVRSLLSVYATSDQDPESFPEAANAVLAELETTKKSTQALNGSAMKNSVESMHKAIEVFQTLGREFPDRREYRVRLARAYFLLAGLEIEAASAADQTPAAAAPVIPGGTSPRQAELEARLALIDKTLATLPPVADDIRNDWRDAWMSRSGTLLSLGRCTDALETWNKVIALDQPDSVAHEWTRRTTLKGAEFEQGQMPWSRGPNADHARAVRSAEFLAGQPDVSQPAVYNAACAHALASLDPAASPAERGRRADRAIALLERIATGGYFQGKKHARELREDADLDALRTREDFRGLVARVAAGK